MKAVLLLLLLPLPHKSVRSAGSCTMLSSNAVDSAAKLSEGHHHSADAAIALLILNCSKAARCI